MYRTLLVASILMLTLVTAVPSAVAAPEPPGVQEPQCVQVYPWSELCGGRVGPFACYYIYGLPREVCTLSIR